MIQHKIEDLFDSGADVIVHQVNCQGVMGSGVARQVRELFPDTYREYVEMCNRHLDDRSSLLGNVLTCAETHNGKKVYIANVFAQNKFGYDGKCYTDYNAFREALQTLDTHIILLLKMEGIENPRIAIPYKIGCDRGGGDWSIVSRIIEKEVGHYDVTLCELPKK